MESRALLAFIISIAILIGYQYLFEPAPQYAPVSQEQPASGEAGPATQPGGAPQELGSQPPVEADVPAPLALGAAPSAAEDRPAANFSEPERTIEVENGLYRVQLTSWGGRLKVFELKDYRLSLDDGSPLLDMVKSGGALPLGLFWVDSEGRVMSDASVVYALERVAGGASAGRKIVRLRGTGPNGETLVKELAFTDGSYLIDYTVRVGSDAAIPVGVGWTREVDPTKSAHFGTAEGPVVFIDGELEAENAGSFDDKERNSYRGAITWAGYADHYFLAAYLPSTSHDLEFAASREGTLGVARLWAGNVEGDLAMRLFVGPKSIKLLDSIGSDLDAAVDLGWFAIVARPLLEVMLVAGRVTGNYGWAILLLTVAIKLVLYPVNRRQAEAMKGMQKIQPELKKIQEKYKDDREKLNTEMMELYRRHKVNPLSGCLPMLLQIPVFIGLYNALLQAIELRHAPFIGWINDLSQPDRLGSLAIPFVSPPGIPVLTLLMGASMVLQQRMMPAAGDPMQQRMMMLMPVVFTVMFINFPSGLVIYWFANNVLSIAQQYVTNRRS